MIYKIKDIAEEISERIDNPSASGYEAFVGLEHYDSGEMSITRYGSTGKLESSMKVFHTGDVLVARRNVYLRRAGVVYFDGLTSGDSIVLRPKEAPLKRLLPFILNTDDFWNYANKNADGSMSKRLSPKLLLEYTFQVPDEMDADKVANCLWAIEKTRLSYKTLLTETDELVKAQFVEMFGDIITNDKKWPTDTLENVSTSRLGKMLDTKKQTGSYTFPYLANFNVQWFHFDLSKLNEMDFDEADQNEFSLQEGDLLVTEGGEVGRCAVWHEEIKPCFYQKALHRVRCNSEKIIPEYLAWWFKIHADYNQFKDIVGTTSIAHLPGVKLKKLNVVIPPMSLQNEFVAFVHQADKSKDALSNTLEKITELRKSFYVNALGGQRDEQ